MKRPKTSISRGLPGLRTPQRAERRVITGEDINNLKVRILEIEEQPPEVVRKVVEVNGGDDWVVPTLEYNGKWRPGKVFDAAELEADLRAWGVIS